MSTGPLQPLQIIPLETVSNPEPSGFGAAPETTWVNTPIAPTRNALSGFLQALAGDPLQGLIRRAAWFGGKQADSLESPEAEPLQNCSNLTVNGGSISFGDVRVGTSTTRYFQINNPNCCPVNYTISGGGYGFAISPTAGQVPANGSVSISVTFTPYNEQYYNGSASVSPGGAGVSFNGRGIR